MPRIIDPLERFLSYYSSGQRTLATQAMLINGLSQHSSGLAFASANYADALACGGPYDLLFTNLYLQQTLCKEDHLFIQHQAVLNQLLKDQETLSNMSHFEDEEACLQFTNKIKLFFEAKPAYIEALNNPYAVLVPCPSLAKALASWRLIEGQTLTIFNDLATLQQCIQDTRALEAFSDHQHILLVLSEPIERQLSSQGFKGSCAETEILCHRLFCRQKALYYGTRRLAAFHRILRKKERDTTLPPPPGLLASFLPNSSRKPRVVQQASKHLHIAHIVPQIHDSDLHAPSNILRTLVKGRTCKTSVLVSDCSHYRIGEYPYHLPASSTFVNSPQSEEYGIKTIHSFKKSAVEVILPDLTLNYSQTAQQLCQILHDLKVDAAVFHHCEAIHLLTAQHCDVPCTAVIEHGQIPEASGFDLIFLRSQEACERLGPKLALLGSAALPLPLITDVKKNWKKEAYLKSYFSLSEEAIILCTASNHLNTRISYEMRWVIKQVVQRYPHVHYLAIGPIDNPSLKHPQVHFLGPRQDVPQILRTVDLYLNDFPVGGAVVISEALAAGCPIITMYSPEGTLSSTHAAEAFGIDKSVKSNSKEDYLSLTQELIENTTLRKEWSRVALDRYEKMLSPEDYARRLTSYLQAAIQEEMCPAAKF